MKHRILSFFVMPLFSLSVYCGSNVCSSPAVAGEIRNGGDVLTIGGAIKVFDEVEYSSPFFPEDQGEAWNALNSQLTKFSKRLPATAGYLKSMFTKGRLTWTFVDAKLKDVADEGPTSIVITHEREQIAVNKGNLIQIRRDIWNKLSPVSRGIIMLHEALWVANGREALKDGSTVRKLIGVLFDPKLDEYLTIHLARTLLDIFPNSHRIESSRFIRTLKFEFSHLNIPTNFHVSEVYTSDTTDIVVTNRTKSDLNGLLMTPFNPSQLIDDLISRGGSLKYTWKGQEFSADLNNLCGDLQFGNLNGWRLPAIGELYTLHRQQFHRTRYLMPVGYPQIRSSTDVAEAFIFPQVSEAAGTYRLITREGLIADFGRNLKLEPATYEGTIQLLCVHDPITDKTKGESIHE